MPAFDLRMRHQATGLVEAGGRTAGVRVQSPDGDYELRADLVVACDGRRSTLREAAGLQARGYGAPMDVLWFRLPRQASDPQDTFGIVDRGHMMVLLNRTDYWQVAFLVPKGSDAVLRARPIDVLRESVAQLAPFLAARCRMATSRRSFPHCCASCSASAACGMCRRGCSAMACGRSTSRRRRRDAGRVPYPRGTIGQIKNYRGPATL